MDGENREQANAQARAEEWLVWEDAIPLRRELGLALRQDPAARRAARSAAAKYGTGGLTEAMVLAGFLEKEGLLVFESVEDPPEPPRPAARRLRLKPVDLRSAVGMSASEEGAACRVLAGAGALELRAEEGYRLLLSREDAPDGEPLYYVLRLETLEFLVDRVQEKGS